MEYPLMHHYVITATATAAIPVSIFGWMMCVAALAAVANGESPRAVLQMPRTILQRQRHAPPTDD